MSLLHSCNDFHGNEVWCYHSCLKPFMIHILANDWYLLTYRNMQRCMLLMSNDEMPREWEIVIYFLALSLESHKKKKGLFHDTFMRRKTIQDLFVDTSNARWCHCRKKFAFALDVLNLICICLGHAYVTSVFDIWIDFLPASHFSSFLCLLLFFLPFTFSSGTCVFQPSILQPEWG